MKTSHALCEDPIRSYYQHLLGTSIWPARHQGLGQQFWSHGPAPPVSSGRKPSAGPTARQAGDGRQTGWSHYLVTLPQLLLQLGDAAVSASQPGHVSSQPTFKATVECCRAGIARLCSQGPGRHRSLIIAHGDSSHSLSVLSLPLHHRAQVLLSQPVFGSTLHRISKPRF